MAPTPKHAPGSFCWLELSTTDQNAAKQFYSSLFGWTIDDQPMGPGQVYTMFNIEGRNAAAAATMDERVRAQGVPPHWMLYMDVESADDTVAKAQQAGGKAMAPPFDVFDFGRMAVLEDPTGAHFSIWQPRQHTGTGITGVPGTLCWADLMTPDQAAVSKFYTSVFGWQIEPGQDNSGYLHIKNGSEFIGGIPPAGQRPPNVPPHWMIYFLVDNCDASASKAKDLGGTLLMPPMTMEKVGRMAIVDDPQGAGFALFQPLPHN
jgi:predicted enzyme related to lactoylglutathione lyase